MDHYAADASAVVEHLDLKNAVHIGHSTGGGEVARYVAQYGQPQGRVAKAVLVSSVPPLMVKTEDNPGGTPIEVFDDFRAALAANRAQFYVDVASGPFYGFNRPEREGLSGRDPELVAPGHDRQRQSALRGHQGLLRNGPDRRPEGDHCSDARYCRATTTRSCRSMTPASSVKLLKNGTLKVYRAIRTAC